MTHPPPPNPPPHPLDYQRPRDRREPVAIGSAFLGVLMAVAAGPGVAVLATVIDSVTSSGAYAGLGGLIIGSIVGGVLTLVALVAGIALSRSDRGRRRGMGIGLLIGSGVTLLGIGGCFMLVMFG